MDLLQVMLYSFIIYFIYLFPKAIQSNHTSRVNVEVSNPDIYYIEFNHLSAQRCPKDIEDYIHKTFRDHGLGCPSKIGSYKGSFILLNLSYR
jgi:hypothetical protein